MLGVVDADHRRREDFVRRHRHADAVRELHHALLLQIGQAHVALDQIVLEHFRALQLHLELADVRDRDAHLVVDAVPLHQVAGAVDARAGTHAGFVRFAILDRFVRRVARAAHGGDAEREPRAALRGAVILLQMRMEFGEAGHHRQVRGIDDFGLEVVRIRVRHDRGDLVARDDHVDIRSHASATSCRGACRHGRRCASSGSPASRSG